MTGQYETHTPANLIQLPVQSEWLRRSPSKFLDGEAAQVSLCNIANTPLTHYTVTCANRTVQAILRNIFASVYGAIGPIHTGNNIAQYGLHSSVCAGNCVVCKGGIGDIAQTGLRSFAVQNFGRRSCAVTRLHRHLITVCPCMRLCNCTGNNVHSVIFHSAIMAPYSSRGITRNMYNCNWFGVIQVLHNVCGRGGFRKCYRCCRGGIWGFQ